MSENRTLAIARRAWIHRPMSGFLNLGGAAGAMTVTTPARALDVPWVPNPARPVLVVATVRITNADANTDAGTIHIYTGPALALAEVCYAAFHYVQGGLGAVLVAFVKPGNQVNIVTEVLDGAPSFSLEIVAEAVL